MRLLILLSLVLLGACTATTPQPTPPPNLQGQVSIIAPLPGTVYYSEVLTIQGTVRDVGAQGFVVSVYNAKRQILASVIVVPPGETWSVMLPLTVDVLTTLTIVTRSTNARVSDFYSSVDVGAAPLAMRPAALYGTIFSPEPDEVVGGEQLLITGTISGETSAKVLLLDNQGKLLAEAPATFSMLSPVDEVPFRAEVITAGYAGPATLQLLGSSGQVMDTVPVMISVVAG